ncbi:diacylglycerol kinase family protein [Pedobacter sp. MR2016-24]|uniref:diacylglycerol kinase family protein n=1 Tax=Pedobacter sp. MR2016-24 TaxID=2994466 RepID=UPI00224516C2|nr:diacylglycerol kinase family protein [Pedobacter sp. MR2016-24]MCX2482356.1 diacylglycerol kinase family protein [Pedobacter sp. MR2016-24]
MRRLIKSFGYALSGIAYTTKTQLNFKIHLLAIAVVSLSGWFLKLTISEWLWIVLAIGLVLVTELVNTAIELLVDLVSPAFNPQAGKVKDIAAGAVLIAAAIAVVTGAIIFIPKLI